MIDVDFDALMHSCVLGDIDNTVATRLRPGHGSPLRLYSTRFTDAEIRAWLLACGFTAQEVAAAQVGERPHPSPRARLRDVREGSR